MDKGQKEYEAYVSRQPMPYRFRPWGSLPDAQRAAFVPKAKPKKAKANAKKK